MKVKKIIKDLGLSIFFFISSLSNFLLYLFFQDTYELFIAIITGIAGIVFMVMSWKGNYYNIFYIAYDSKYYLDKQNLLEDVIIIKEKKMFRYKKILRDKLIKPTYKIVYNKAFNFRFKVYELKDNFHLIIINNSKLNMRDLYFNDKDRSLNTDVLIDNVGIKPLEVTNYINKYTSNDKKNKLLIYKFNDVYLVSEYRYSTGYAHRIKQVFDQMIPFWYKDDDHNVYFDKLNEANIYAVDRLNMINGVYTLNGKPLKYFMLPMQKIGTAYHEFQKGDKKGIFWDKNSLLIAEDIMDRHKLGEFFDRVIPEYDYYGRNLVDEEVWQNIQDEVIHESEVIQEIIQELSLWAAESILEFECFTILGI